MKDIWSTGTTMQAIMKTLDIIKDTNSSLDMED